MTEAEAIANTNAPATAASLTRDLQALDLRAGDLVIVHSSLSRLGWVAGGAQAVVEALFASIGTSGTIAMPTQSGQLTDPANWDNPAVPAEWVPAVRDGLPAFDAHLTPTRQMGQVVECFRQHRDTLRSNHPTVSWAANGPLAATIVSTHALTPQAGETSPLGRMYELDAKVLLLGVDHGNNTSLHLAEHRAEWAGKKRMTDSAPIMIECKRVWATYDNVEADDSDFAKLGEAFAATGNETQGPVGAGIGRIFQQRAIVDFAVDWMESNR